MQADAPVMPLPPVALPGVEETPPGEPPEPAPTLLVEPELLGAPGAPGVPGARSFRSATFVEQANPQAVQMIAIPQRRSGAKRVILCSLMPTRS